MIGIAIFSIVLLYFIYRGYRLGLGLVLARLASLVGAYFLAITFAAKGATLLSEKTPLQGLAAYFVAGLAIFIVSAIVISIVLRILLHILGKATDGQSALPIPGAVANGLIGVFVGLGLVWFANMANTAITQGELPEDNLVNNWSQKLMGGAIDNVLTQQFPQAPQLVGVASYVLKNPASSIKDGIALANDPDVERLVNSQRINRMVQKRDVLGLMTASEINAVLDNTTVQRILDGTNVLGDVDVTDKTAVKMRLTEEVMTTLIRVEAVKQNPRFKTLSNDPGLNRMLNKGDVFGLMNSPKVKEMSQIIMDSGIIK
ncbi:CvpA family protein [uncultured Paraglaciecola sp.]|uniref:CvpA family protein n=1 Tax=uncultured Paraglaciecola sp. TaxID=1765024 RepID=UPI0030DA585F|tara:strand:+ start:73901 stop:74848 length:948 start_codon:yes stop_codon:yes gene_type:complete